MFREKDLHFADIHVSEPLESYDIPDTYVWRFNKQGQLIPEYDNTPVQDIVFRENLIGEIEYQALLKIQKEILEMDSGYAVWISPIHPIHYPFASKIVISEKIGDRVLNKSIKTSWDIIGSVLAARDLALLSDTDPNIFKSANDVRANPIFINKDKEEELALALKRILSQRSIKMMEEGEDVLAKEVFMRNYLEGKNIPLGPSPLTCPRPMAGPTAFQVFSGEDEYGPLHFECPLCHQIITRPPRQFISKCRYCRADIRC